MKTALKNKSDIVQSAITPLRKDLRKARKEKEHAKADRLEDEIVRLERSKSFYSPSVEPVQFSNGFVLNGKLLKQFIKKLPGNMKLAAIFTDERTLEIRHANGKLTLLDLQVFYEGLKMPKGEELFDELGISLS